MAMLLLLEFLQPAHLLQSQVFLLLPAAHLEAELVLPEDAVDSRLLYLHVVSLSELPISWIVACYVSQLLPPVRLLGTAA